MTRNERDLQAAVLERKRFADEIQEIWKKAEDEDRETTHEERGEVETRLKNIETTKQKISDLEEAIKVEKGIRDLSTGLGNTESVVKPQGEPAKPKAKSIGEMFVESKQYQEAKSRGFSGDVKVASVELDIDMKTLLDSTLTSGGDLIFPPDVQPGIVQTLFERLTVADLLMQGTTTSNTIHYMKETTATNNASAVLEGGTKPESALVFDAVEDPVRKIATFLPVTDEMLEDVQQIRSYLNARLSLFVKIHEEYELLQGNGTAPQITGILNRANIGTQARGSDSNEVALYKGLDKVRTVSFLEPDAIVIHPTNYQTIRLAKDSSGQYYGGGPFLGPYGGPQGPASTNFYTADNLWGKRVVVTSNIPVNTALVGAFGIAAQLFRRSGVTVEASNSHSTFFVENKTAIRAEERAGLAVYREQAFVKCTGLN